MRSPPSTSRASTDSTHPTCTPECFRFQIFYLHLDSTSLLNSGRSRPPSNLANNKAFINTAYTKVLNLAVMNGAVPISHQRRCMDAVRFKQPVAMCKLIFESSHPTLSGVLLRLPDNLCQASRPRQGRMLRPPSHRKAPVADLHQQVRLVRRGLLS